MKYKMQWNIENVILLVNKHFEINQILASNNPFGVAMPLNRQTNSKKLSPFTILILSTFCFLNAKFNIRKKKVMLSK